MLVVTEQATRQSYLATFKTKIRPINPLKNANTQQLPNVVIGLKNLRNQIKKGPLDAVSLERTMQEFEAKLTHMALSLTGIDHRAEYLRLDVQAISINRLLDQLKQQLPNRELHYLSQTTHQQIVGDPIKLITLLKNTVLSFPDHNGDQPEV